MKAKLQSLLARRAEVEAERDLLDRSLKGGAPTDEQIAKSRSLNLQLISLRDAISDERALEAEVLTLPPDSARAARRGGSAFNDFADFAAAVVRAGQGRGYTSVIDERLLGGVSAGPSTYGNESSGADGGFLVPTEYAAEAFSISLEGDSLLAHCRPIPVSGNSMSLPVSESTPWGTAGVQLAWEAEAAALAQSKPKFESRELKLRKLTGLVPCTAELLEDAPALGAWLIRELGRGARWHINDAIVNGSGPGRPQGFSNSGAVVEQAKVTSQVADTIVAGNIAAMYARNTSPSTATWLINPDAFPQIPLMTIGDQPVWTPPQEGFKNAPGGLLLGRPLVLTDAAQTIGDAGDVYFADLQGSYAVIQKRSGPRIDTSMHLWFDHDTVAFRFVFRIDGQSLVRSVVTPPNSAVTRSPWVRLAARA